MKINTSKNTKSTNYKAFSVVMVETPRGMRVVGALGSKKDNPASDEDWTRIDSRNFSRALNASKLVIN